MAVVPVCLRVLRVRMSRVSACISSACLRVCVSFLCACFVRVCLGVWVSICPAFALPCLALPCPALPCPALSGPVLSCLVLSCPVLSYTVLSCPVFMQGLTSYCVIAPCRACCLCLIVPRVIVLYFLVLSCLAVALPVAGRGSKNREAVPSVGRASQQLGPGKESLLL